MVLLPEDAAMTLAELRQMAARQQHQIEAQQQLLVAKEQRLKFLKQQEARHHSLTEHQLDSNFLQNLRDKIEKQELKLRELRSLRSQVEQQKTNNDNLGTELDSIRALFGEKEKELNLAVSKVDELTRQLDEIRNNKAFKKCTVSSTASEIENLRRELLYRTKLSEQQNAYICQQRDDIALKQQDIAILDQKINELTHRLHSKRLLNDQLASQIHHAALSRNYNNSVSNNGFYHPATVVAVEPLPRESLESEQTKDDMAAKLHGSHKGDLGEFSLNKNDPKYQTLPYNTKFTLKGKCEDSLSSSNEDDSWPNSLDSSASSRRNPPLSVVKPSSVSSQPPLPIKHDSNESLLKISRKFNESFPNLDKTDLNGENVKKQGESKSINVPSEKLFCETISSAQIITVEKSNEKPKVPNSRSTKPAVPPKPALPVKPMVANKPSIPLKNKCANEKDVTAALGVLQNRTLKTDKSIARYSGSKESTQTYSPKSKIATYMHKVPADASNSQESRRNEITDGDVLKKKTAVGQLPIKPKPLTIRKTPGLEPPKLKVQPVNTSFQRKNSDSNLNSQLKATYTQSHLENSTATKLQKPAEVKESDESIPVVEVAPMKNDIENSSEIKTAKPEKDSSINLDISLVNKEKMADNSDEVDLCRLPMLSEKCDVSSEVNLDSESDDEKFHSAAFRRMRKGNLKGENSSRNCRRVSFDPLALLLDAALEGELELVKKTAKEVPNPSAANDEGITALHNAICAGHIDVATFLVEFGCDVNAQDCDGWTPLHCAASCNNLPMVKFLVERGACVFATTLSDHETASEKCEEDEEGFDGCSEYLYSLQEGLGVLNGGCVFAVYDYEAQNADELGFRDGERLAVLRKGDDDESEWWWSRAHDREGYVPRNLLGLYPRVSSQKDLESDKPTD